MEGREHDADLRRLLDVNTEALRRGRDRAVPPSGQAVDECTGEALLAEVVIREATLVAHPIVVDVRVVPRHEPPRATVLVVDLDVAARRAAVADARRCV